MAEQKTAKPYFADVFNAVYLFHKKWNGTGYGDADWEQIMHEATQLRDKVAPTEDHPLYTYCTDVLMSALAEIERERGKRLMIGVIVLISAIAVSVFFGAVLAIADVEDDE